jgi:inhibitor of KinA
VPAGSVAIAGRQTGIYPFPTPGGWHLVGRSPVRLFLPDADPPSLFRAGDRVKLFAAE